MSIFSLKRKPAISLVFDIRDTSISVAAVRFEKNKKPELVSCQNLKIEAKDPTNHERYLISMLNTLDNSIFSIRKNLIKMGNKNNIEKYFYFIGSPWSVSQSKMIKIVKDRSYEITNDLLEKIITNEKSSAENLLEKSSEKADWVLLEEKIIQVKLNGYKTEKIFNRKTNDLEAELFISFIPAKIKNQIDRFTNKNIGKIKAGHLNSSAFSAYMFFRDLYQDKNSFIYIDIGDLITDAYIVKEDVIYGVISFPYGEKTIINTIVKKSGQPENIVLSSLSMTCHGVCDEKTVKTISDLINPAISEWLEKLNSYISKVSTEMDIPKNVFMMENSDLIRTMVREIKKNGNMTILGTKMEISYTGEGALNNCIVNGKVFKNEPYIKMDLVFLDKMVQK